MGRNRQKVQDNQAEDFQKLTGRKHTKTVKEKYGIGGSNESYGYKKFSITDKQKECLDIIENNTITFIEGLAGSGKSLCALYYAVKEYLVDPTKKIVVIRTPMEATVHDKVGFLLSELKDKLEPHFASSKLLLEQLLSPSKVAADMGGKNERIQFRIPNFILGATLDSCITIIDEGQILHPTIMKLLLERIGQNSKCIILGDPSQVYNSQKDRQGMADAIDKFFDKDKNPLYKDVAYFKFDIDHCMRSDIVKTVLKAYSGVK